MSLTFTSVNNAMPELHEFKDRNGFYQCESREVLVKTSHGKHQVMTHNGDGWNYNPHTGEAVSIDDMDKLGEIVSWAYI